MSASDYQPFVMGPVLSPRPADAPAADDGFEAGRSGARFSRFRDDRQSGVQTLAALAAPQENSLPWSSGLVALRKLPTPPLVKPNEWDRIVWTALTLSDRWGQAALALGWTALDLFGCPDNLPCARLNANGLAACLYGWSGDNALGVIDIGAEFALLETTRTKDRLRHWRYPRKRAVPMWIGYANRPP